MLNVVYQTKQVVMDAMYLAKVSYAEEVLSEEA